MTLNELGVFLKHVQEHHSVANTTRDPKHRQVKYIRPQIDMRSGECWCVLMEGFGWSKTFFTNNEAREYPMSLEARCVKFLEGDNEVL